MNIHECSLKKCIEEMQNPTILFRWFQILPYPQFTTNRCCIHPLDVGAWVSVVSLNPSFDLQDSSRTIGKTKDALQDPT